MSLLRQVVRWGRRVLHLLELFYRAVTGLDQQAASMRVTVRHGEPIMLKGVIVQILRDAEPAPGRPAKYYIDAVGLRPLALLRMSVRYPDGKLYTHMYRFRFASWHGSLPSFVWDPAVTATAGRSHATAGPESWDPPGPYPVRLMTWYGREIGTFPIEVGYDQSGASEA